MEKKSKLLGNFIRKERKKRHMSMAALADKCDLSISHISRIEKGKDSLGKEISPSLATISRIANALDIDLHTMLINSGYVTKKDGIVDPTEKCIMEFLSLWEIQQTYQFDFEGLNSGEKKDVYRILSDSLDLISFKYGK